ncbi:hypothetical protein JQ604_11565 [Bradyrhizobium jicamae]|jgi:hypothetical protein|uniref:hypothetical protein n=1 Tax=Bradyrhizobium jicamae TaxID=280332 RepID=UPI001BAD5BB9|nr:hypothetical protein [Bradyrhizobium jicamae]MBR0752823.1 hypothetical protein [Bradyrhizobium jicamae]
MNNSFDVREISIEALDVAVGGAQGDGSGTGTGTGHGGHGLARAIRGIIGAIGDTISSIIHMF